MVVINYDNGHKYDGEIKDGKKHGCGTFYYKNGGKYEGEWRDDVRCGEGENTWASKLKYKGQWRNNRRNGQGTIYYPDGGKYEGGWENDQRQGDGTNIWANGMKYVGEWENNLQHGQGTLTYSDGGKYEGEWVRGKRDGYGENYWANGDHYEGQWEKNLMHGEGTLHYADGNEDEKEWTHYIHRPNGTRSPNARANQNNRVNLNIYWLDGAKLTLSLVKAPSKSANGECPYLSLAREYIRSLGWDKAFFLPTQDRCYCSNCYNESWNNTIKAGNSDYVIPRGWVRLGLTVDSVVAQVHDIWNKWIVTFHGTTLAAAQSILTHRNFCWPGDVLLDGTQLKIRDGHIPGQNHVYTSPTIAYSGSNVYSKTYRFHSKLNNATFLTQIVLQCRQMPNSFNIGPETIGAGKKQLCQHIPNDRIEYFTDRRATIIAYGLLVRFAQAAD